jgi:amino acid adenylation domain-containing protein
MNLVYDRQAFGDELVGRLGQYYVRAYERMLAGLDEPHHLETLLGEDELGRLLAASTGVRADYPLDLCSHQLFARQAAQTPTAVAVAYGTQSLTYQELDEKSSRLARHLREVGVGAESRVGIHLRRSPETLIALLGVLKCGAAYVPLEVGLPAERLAYMTADAGVEWVLTATDLAGGLSPGGVVVLVMDDAATDPAWLAGFASTDTADGAGDLSTEATPDSLAYVLYTSGSTGRPKGVMVEHRGLTNYLSHASESYLAEGVEGSVVSSPLGFDATLTTLLAPLVAGRKVELLPDDESVMDELAGRLFGSEEALLFKLTPAHLEALQYVERPAEAGAAAHVIVVGGEQLGAALLRKWKGELLPKATFVNEYGPTEAVVGCTTWTLFDGTGLAELEGRAAVPIGRPIANTQLYVLDAQGRVAPEGVDGELYVGGVGVARGYLNLEGLTRERFVSDPFAAGGGRLYKTGDVGRWLPSGELEYVGRNDEQVKVRGYRIEPGEVEAALEAQAGVRQAVVVAREDEPGRKRLVAYVVAEQGEAELGGALRTALQASLPDYMVPSAFVVLDELPLTPNGKVDRKALPAPEGEYAEAAAYVAPRNEVEQAICEVWEEVLNRAQIGVEDNFFSLGGDSILSLRIVAMLKARGVSLEVKDLFQHQTAAQLALQVRQGSAAAEEPSLEPFSLLTEEERASLPGDYEDAYPMSALQAGMVFHTQLEEFSGVYHEIVSEHVRCPWDEGLFAQALAACVEEHPVLRTTFLLGGQRPLQVVRRSVELPLEVEDIRGIPAEEQERYLTEWVERRKRHVFDWEHGPLYQIDIFRRTDESIQFVVSFHHAVMDGWSRVVLTTELYNRYERLLSGGEPEPVAVDWTYRDFVAQEQHVLADPAAKAYFAEMLEGVPARQLPRLRTAGGERGDGARIDASIAVEGFTPLSDRLVELARRLGVPVQAVLLAGHFKALSTMSGQRRAVSAVAHNGRPETAGAERSVGLYLNSLPLSLELPEGSWRDLIRAVAEMSARSMQYRGYPLSKIQQDVGATFDEVSFNYVHFHAFRDLTKSEGQELESLGGFGYGQTNFKLLADISRDTVGDRMTMILIYDRQAFGDELVGRLGQYYVRAYERMLAGLDEPHHLETLLDDEELRRLLSGWNQSAEYPGTLCLHELFEAQAERSPEAVALTFGESTLTYRQLNEQSNRLAHYLRGRGVRPDALVGLCVERSLGMVVAILGILKAGGAYLPLDPAQPRERLDYMVEDAAPALLLTQASLRDRLAGSRLPLLVLDGEGDALAAYPADNPGRDLLGLTDGHLAYVIYTSGSTGRPKGVMVEHRQVRRLLDAAQADFGFGPADVWTMFHSYAFDFSVWELWGALARGGRLVLVPSLVARSPEEFYGLLLEEGVTVLNQTPTAFTQLARADAEAGGELALRVVVFGGEALNPAELRGWVGRRGDERPALVNMYGITETTVHVTYRRLLREDVEGSVGSVLGRPLGDLRVYLLNVHGVPVPEGTVGEMYVGGAGVARGYLRRPALTAERFVPDPFVEGGRLYRTGDLARYTAQGELEYLGRADEQVKVRGYRIELGEIEAALAATGLVEAAAVVAREYEPGQKRLVAYVVPAGYAQGTEGAQAERDSVTVGACREALAARLPDYMVPAHFVLLERLPLTPNGKLDRKALPAPDAGDAYSAPYVAARDETEQAICEVWQEVLRHERVGVEDNFFSLGGDSILSIRVVSLLRARGIWLDIKDIFQHQTVALLARQARGGGGAAEEPELEPFALLTEGERSALADDYEDAYPMSALQMGMVFHTQLEGFNGVYHDITGEHVRCPWDEESFARALAVCIQEHPVLRTSFLLDRERPLQVVHRSIELPLAVEDLRHLGADEQELYLSEWMERRKRHVFDWERGPLFSVHIFLRTDESIQFVSSFHHSVLDGWSRAVLTTELYNRYERLLSGGELEEAEVDWTYRDFVAQEQRAAADPEARDYFARMLEDAPAQQLPRPRVAGRAETAPGSFLVEGFAPLSAGLVELARKLGVPVQAVLMAAHLKVLSTVSGQRRAVSAVAHNGRPETAGAERSVGLYLNSLPLSLELKDGSWRELIRDVAEVSAAGVQHRGYPLSRIQQELGRSFSEVLFNYTHFHVYNDLAQSEGRGLEVLGTSSFGQTNFELTASFSRGMADDSIYLWLRYERRVLDDELVARLGRYYVRACELMLGHMDEPHHARPLLTEEEAHLLLEEWNETAAEYPTGAPLHQLFEAQVGRSPDSVAVSFEGDTLTYRELNERANRLAHYLRGRGVKPDTLVALCLERSLEMVVGILGVLKAGGAYVPLDPSYPRERLAFMLEDSGAAVLLTQGRLLPLLAGFEGEVVCLDADPGAASGQSAEDPAAGVTGENLAYVIYTSGSTGRPKGVLVEHRSIVNHLLWRQDAYPLSEADCFLQKASFSFDISVWEIFAPLTAGARLLLARPGGQQDSAYLVGLIAEAGVTVAHFGPAMLQAFLLEPGVESCTSLRRVFCGGEPLSADLQALFHGRLQAALHSQYGPTETTVDVTAGDCVGVCGRPNAPIGRPIANTRIYLLDAHGQLAAPGVPGELHVGGAALARGYLGRVGLTAERFIPNPYADTPGGRLYRTGDVARYLDDGSLEFLGRLDQQVKVRGYRVELGEVEAALAAHPRVHESVVVATEYSPTDKRLVAYVVPAGRPRAADDAAAFEGTEQSATELRAFLQSRLPEYMVPSAFVLLDELPLTTNGKIDRKALPAPDAAAATGEYAAPETPTEEALQAIWQAALSVPSLSVTAGFSELGGHSLLAIHLMSKVNKYFGSSLQLSDLFLMQTVREMAAHLDSRLPSQEEERASVHPNLLELKAGEPSASPLFLVHAVGGYAHAYGELAVNLDYQGSIYGLQAAGGAPETVEAMAERYVEAVRRVRPDGPYLLGGWSMGGVVAYEMARQLKEAREDVGWLLMLDSFCPAPGAADNSDGVSADDERVLLQIMASELGITTRGLDPSEEGALREMTVDELLATVLSQGKKQKRLPADFGLEELKERYALTLKNSVALRAYRPSPLDVEIELIRAAEGPGNVDRTLGWGSVAAKVSVTEQSGDHFSMMRQPHLPTLAETVSTLIKAHVTTTLP